MKFVVDMNLSPKWVEQLRSAGHDAIHWSTVGEVDAADEELAGWARSQARVVLTADLDFGSLLAASGANGPSVVQLRSPVLRVSVIGEALVKAIASASDDLEAGSFMSFDGSRLRVRRLPFSPLQ